MNADVKGYRGSVFLVSSGYLFCLPVCLFVCLFSQVEVGKEKKARHSCYQKAAVILSLVFLLLTICVFSLRHFWSPSPGKVRTLTPIKGAVRDSNPTHSLPNSEICSSWSSSCQKHCSVCTQSWLWKRKNKHSGSD